MNNKLELQRYQKQYEDAKVRLGTETWETAKFKGTLYDYDTPVDEYLQVYASQFDSVEYQASFFDAPSEREMRELKEEVENVNKDFQFCPVIPRRISHELPLGESPFDMEEFISAINCLGAHLGPCILRLPETLAPNTWQVLLRFLKVWPKDKKVVIQPTHAEWFKKTEAWKPLLGELRKFSAGLLIEDRIEQPLNTEKLLTCSHLVIRFFGRPQMNMDDQRLALWIYKLGEYKGYGIKDSYFFLHEEEEMCLGILRKMANSMGGNVRVPGSYDLNQKQLGFKF